ncbi:hypothetical protein B9Z55_023522 [Caenorhabditis nigoni]|uniref:Uncharacterized protein n=1 Tax=Caenorhabditis nigoni TaxID=1611254 RepID=A0A2G5SQJ8_9PELO|nr:hypothetical protein B9Z55_023522 [Caenorhabditis nigoni]
MFHSRFETSRQKATLKPAQLLGHQQRLQNLRSKPSNRRCHCSQIWGSRYNFELEDTATGYKDTISFIF